MDWAVTFIPWEDGQAILTTLADASERRLLEEERLNAEVLRLQIQQERELIELREQFIKSISHEFRTPLAVIQSSSELLEHYYDRLSPDGRVDHLHEMQKQVRHMTEMVDDFLRLSKVRAGKTRFFPEPMDVGDFCRMIVSRVGRTAGNAYRLRFTSDGVYGNHLVDEKLLSHILTNLLTNAVKYSPHGGDICLSLTSDGHDLIFQISDQGIGIPEADQSHLFEPFQRGSNVKRIEGTGLGLAVVKNSVLLHGGTIELKSKEGEGTVFTVRLPRVEPATG
jgi:signal transduction histidine kinase